MARLLTKRWPFCLTPQSIPLYSGDAEHPVGLSLHNAIKWFWRSRQWRVDFTYSQPQLVGPPSTTAGTIHLEATGFTNHEKLRMCAHDGLDWRDIDGDDFDGSHTSNHADPVLLLCTPGGTEMVPGYLPSPTMDRMIKNLESDGSYTYWPSMMLTMRVFVGGLLDEVISTYEDLIDDTIGVTGGVKRNFTADFAGTPVTIWWRDIATDPPGPATWTLDLNPHRYFEFRQLNGGVPLVDMFTGEPLSGINIADYQNPLA